jgi:hypothetical protein
MQKFARKTFALNMVAPDIFEGCFLCSAKVLDQSQLGQRSQFSIIQN